MSIRRTAALRAALPGLAVIAAFGALAAALAGCGGDEPVAQVKAEPAAVRMAYPQPVPVRLTWTPEKPIESETGQLLVFAHLLSGPKRVVRTFDHPFPQPWTPGKPVSYTLALDQSALAPPIAPGSYRLSIGLYDGDRERWALGGGEEIARREYALVDVEVPPTPPPSPKFAFGTAWGAVEKTGDSQTLLRRWIDGMATLGISAVPAAGSVVLKVRIPEVNQQGGERLLLDAGTQRPLVIVGTTCDGKRRRMGGFGLHTIEVPVAAGQSCDIVLNPRFKVARVDTIEPRSPAFLEALLWKPEAPAPAR